MFYSKNRKIMSTLGKAIALASNKFEDKLDKAGQPYILHCIRVMNSVNTTDKKIAAILHDVVEDTDITISDLLQMGFSPKVVGVINLLTHDKSVLYTDYIKLIGTNEIATEIKIADLIDNSNITRLKGIEEKDFKRMRKYHEAYTYLLLQTTKNN